MPINWSAMPHEEFVREGLALKADRARRGKELAQLDDQPKRGRKRAEELEEYELEAEAAQ